MNLKNNIHIVFYCFFIASYTYSQTDTNFNTKKIDYPTFIQKVNTHNFNYAAEKLNLNIAQARILNAQIFPDPNISAGWFDNGEARNNMGYGFLSSVDWTIETGGKRKKRINIAKSEYEITYLMLADYWRNLRADATLIFLDALKKKLIFNVELSSYNTMLELYRSDSIRAKLGSINNIDALQTKVEAGIKLKDALLAQAEWKTSLTHLHRYTGYSYQDTLFLPISDLNIGEQNFQLEQLIQTALKNRNDFMVALKNKELADKYVQLAKANRLHDLNLSFNTVYASYSRNIIAPTPSFLQKSLSISFPLKFSNNKSSELKEYLYQKKKSELTAQQIEIEIQSEVLQAYFNYLSLQKAYKQFNQELLESAKKVLNGKIYSYKRGESSLLEVLNAQRTYNETQIAYYETLFNFLAALVELERSVGIWDLQF
ncbi:MAG: TolC family protein [Bacteroidia bacterium]|nr:TolC family protein [Bacteroidia bacterium]